MVAAALATRSAAGGSAAEYGDAKAPQEWLDDSFEIAELHVLPSWQGRGIGRDVLARACRMLRADGRSRVTLEVETENEHALGLYTSSGFVREAGEDYWRVEL